MFGFGVSAAGDSTPSNIAINAADSQQAHRTTGFSKYAKGGYDCETGQYDQQRGATANTTG